MASVKWNDLHYYDNPYTRHEETYEELISDVGQETIYHDIITDAATRNCLDDYFALDRLCAPRKKFIWLYRRRLREAYPVYKDQMDMWATRVTLGWFKDNGKLNKTITAENIQTIGNEVSKAIGTVDTTVKDNYNSSVDSTTTSKDTSNGKQRGFAFNYPESNYSGGVIPYDIDNNPSVEFINTQSDSISKSTTESETISNVTTDSTDTTVTDTDTTDNTNTDTTGSTDRDVVTTFEYTGTDISALADQILAQLPITDFFKQFTNKLKTCFQGIYLVDEQLEEEGEDYYV